jgi:hypothetical protein
MKNIKDIDTIYGVELAFRHYWSIEWIISFVA